jgi:hypothetical protein
VANESPVSALQAVVDALRRTEIRFRRASLRSRSAGLRALFDAYARQRRHFSRELAVELESLDAPRAARGERNLVEPARTVPAPAMPRALEDDAPLVERCARSENAAVRSYSETLERDLPPSFRRLIERQLGRIKTTLDRIRALKHVSG